MKARRTRGRPAGRRRPYSPRPRASVQHPSAPSQAPSAALGAPGGAGCRPCPCPRRSSSALGGSVARSMRTPARAQGFRRCGSLETEKTERGGASTGRRVQIGRGGAPYCPSSSKLWKHCDSGKLLVQPCPIGCQSYQLTVEASGTLNFMVVTTTTSSSSISFRGTRRYDLQEDRRNAQVAV